MTDWAQANQRVLGAALEVVRCAVEDVGADAAVAELEAARAALPAPAALDEVAAAFGLSPFERDVLLLCAGIELSTEFRDAVRGHGGPDAPTFGFALATLPEPHWTALLPAAPLRRWRLVEPAPGDTLAARRLRIDERILHQLTGVSYLDPDLQQLLEPLGPAAELPPSQAASASRLAALLSRSPDGERPPAVQLVGDGWGAARAVAAAAAAEAGLRVHALRAEDVPTGAADRDLVATLLDREGVLGTGVPMIEHDGDGEGSRAARVLAERLAGTVLVAGREPLALRRAAIRLEIPRPAAAEQRALWAHLLGPRAADLNGQLDRLVSHFSLSPDGIRAVCHETRADASADAVWRACRAQARPRLEGLAQRIEPAARADDLVLPEAQHRILRDIGAHVRGRAVVHDDWGFAESGTRGLGITALFAGPSGTGKTMAAEVVAADLGVDLYRIDLSAVVSKYIGETEKNLARVFDAAEEGGAVLLFDEADALFGKRSEVKDSHDRYANIEVGYLLQRMEAYRGLAILTTNMKAALDSAFLRRIRFVVQFPYPGRRAARADLAPHLPAAHADARGSTSAGSHGSTWPAAASATSRSTRPSSPPTRASRSGWSTSCAPPASSSRSSSDRCRPPRSEART